PRAASADDTVDLPDPMPPVSPTTSAIAAERTIGSIARNARSMPLPVEPMPASAPSAPPGAHPDQPTATVDAAPPQNLLAGFSPLLIAVRWGTIAVGLVVAYVGRDQVRDVSWGVALV